jgi:hypothetical protein
MDPWQIAFIAVVISLCLSLPRLLYTRGGGVSDYGQLARVERKLDLVLKHLGLELSVQAPARVQELASTGRKVAAIKALREANPWMGIKEAKDYVEGLIGPR